MDINMLDKTFKETYFDDGDAMLYDEKEEKTYILNKTSIIVYEKLKTKAFASLDELYKSIIDEYEDYPKEYFEEVIKKFKEYGILK